MAGGLFVLKILYVLSVVIALPFSRGALYVSSTRRRITAVLNELPIQNHQTMVDLGCGDGRVLRMAKKRFDITAIGYEVNPLAFVKAKILCLTSKNIYVHYTNFYKADLSKADIICCYLFPDVMKKVSQKLIAELKNDTYIVSFNFKMPNFVPQKILYPKGSLHNDPIYIYKKAPD